MEKKRHFRTPRGLLSLVGLIFALIFMALLNGAVLEEGVPDAYSAFVTVAFSILPFALIISWVSFTWKWPNIFWIALPLTGAIFLFLMLYSFVWKPSYTSEVGQEKYKKIYETVRNASPQVWGCANGWTVAKMNVSAKPQPNGKTVAHRYVFLSGTMSEPPYGLATKYTNGDLEVGRYSDNKISALIRSNLKTCAAPELANVKNLFYRTSPAQ